MLRFFKEMIYDNQMNKMIHQDELDIFLDELFNELLDTLQYELLDELQGKLYDEMTEQILNE